MEFVAIIILLVMFILILTIVAIAQMKSVGIEVKDFIGFVQANETLELLYNYSKKYDSMTPQEQVMYLDEAKKMFDAFEKIPDALWQDEYDKYSQVLDTYQNIRVMKWNSGENNER